jgi:hypothetical protein
MEQDAAVFDLAVRNGERTVAHAQSRVTEAAIGPLTAGRISGPEDLLISIRIDVRNLEFGQISLLA